MAEQFRHIAEYLDNSAAILFCLLNVVCYNSDTKDNMSERTSDPPEQTRRPHLPPSASVQMNLGSAFGNMVEKSTQLSQVG